MTQIPFPGGSGVVPSGAIQFQGDWPGLFLRGDEAVTLLPGLRAILEHAPIASLPDTCWSAHMQLARIADIIEREVVARNNPAV